MHVYLEKMEMQYVFVRKLDECWMFNNKEEFYETRVRQLLGFKSNPYSCFCRACLFGIDKTTNCIINMIVDILK